jgi:prevent-host-death family protein
MTAVSPKSPRSKAAASKRGSKSSRAKLPAKLPGRWALQDAKARFSELVRKAQKDGPQHVTVHGQDAVVVLSQAEYLKLTGVRTGLEIIELFANSPLQDVEIEHPKIYGPISDPVDFNFD